MTDSRNVSVSLIVAIQLVTFADAFYIQQDTMSAKCIQAGPDYWCQSYNTVLECNVVEKCGNLFRQSTTVLFDQSKCSSGTSFWCHNLQNAVRCGQHAVEQCVRGQHPQPPSPVPGSDPCLSGPSYWCRSMDVALTCGNGAFEYCKNRQRNPDPLPGSNECTWGPNHICKSFQLAAKCGATFTVCKRQYGSSHEFNSQVKYKSIPHGFILNFFFNQSD